MVGEVERVKRDLYKETQLNSSVKRRVFLYTSDITAMK